MVGKIVMPRLDWGQAKGTVGKWLKKEGENVKEGESVVEVESQKTAVTVESPVSGILRKILVADGMEVSVGQVIAIVTEAGEELPPMAKEEVVQERMVKLARLEEEKIGECVKASPRARKLAKQYDVDLAQVFGTSLEKRITEDDVRRFVERIGARPRIREVIQLTEIRKAIAERLSQSVRAAPHVTLMMEVDASDMTRIREQLLPDLGISYTDIIVKATAKTLEEYPFLNSMLDGEQIKVFDEINIGIAVETNRGLLVPVIHNSDKKSLKEISLVAAELVKKAKERRLSKEELTGGTFTVTNLGMFDVDAFTPIINPGETAILGVGRIVEKPVITNKRIEVRPVTYMSLTFDHRVVDGAPAARFLQRLKHVLEHSYSLLT